MRTPSETSACASSVMLIIAAATQAPEKSVSMAARARRCGRGGFTFAMSRLLMFLDCGGRQFSGHVLVETLICRLCKVKYTDVVSAHSGSLAIPWIGSIKPWPAIVAIHNEFRQGKREPRPTRL